MTAEMTCTDVFICGGGPVGLLLAYSLARQGISSQVAEMYERKVQENFGRATTMYPRTLELLEREDLFDQMAQIGFFARNATTYKDGHIVPGRGWQILWKAMKDSFHPYVLNIRQKYSEQVFRENYEAFGYQVHYGWEVVGYDVDTSIGDGYNVTVQTQRVGTDEQNTVRCKYLVGADGGRSKIRRLSNIRMEGDTTAFNWVRMDGKYKTNMPFADAGVASIETESHGNVLWVRLDHDAYRIGYVLSPKLYEKYGDNITEEQAKYEAIEAMKPFSLDIERVDWMTCYGIGQRVAEKFFSDDYVLLAGDAGHTHSSGFAQGLNTGIHDSTNLAWKLAGTIKGRYQPAVLQSYKDERRPSAQHLIEIDKAASAAISGVIPPRYKQLAAETSPNQVLRTILEETAPFTVGLGIDYPDSILNRPEQRKIMISQGSRAPDVLLQKPGALLRTRLYDVNKAPGLWTVLVFTGNTATTKPALAQLREALALESSFAKQFGHVLRFLTVIPGTAPSVWSALGGPAFGKMFIDPGFEAHDRYGIPHETGAIVVLRPDAVLGFVADFGDVGEINKYFAGFCNQ
ncbi:pentachlorophenol 4-monooxygenase [Diplodia corticola]|uniref:Pentachlorophenol 4-monooxygenase n=1 Tax=Diplodia corticola TaxID=236234 RepID=A0A1J9RLN9_9PEZI|nr:pentachlorophenol 4-monooxygenase [Diplodia corticola]OJD33491.1 pentachlorophenol 4-monooxygenase [Diplodia corticola]